jgi:hypothetical protein
MACTEFEKLRSAIDEYISKEANLHLETVSKSINKLLFHHAEQGRLELGKDKDLVGDGLEIRVRILLLEAGFDVAVGRPGLEDLIVQVPDKVTTKRPLVLEVKSDRKPTVKRDDLRQLDDWVFDLSGEEKARKHGLGGGVDALAIVTDGLLTSKKHHPTPHKGVFVFNAPVGVDFIDRPANVIGADEVAFAKKRGFCLIPIDLLISKVESIKKKAVRHRNSLGVHSQM